MFWGFSEALDLVEEINRHAGSRSEYSILLYGGGDPRFILKILSKHFQRPDVKVNIFVCEGCVELIARYLMLLGAALEDTEKLSTRAKTLLFMDIYGNTLVRPSTFQYIWSKARHLRRVLTDEDFKDAVFPILNFEELKFRERDLLENALEFMTHKPQYVFDIKRYWEERLRSTLGIRFDTRKGAFDWDLQMKLKEYGAKTICTQEYGYFRETGIAFTFPEFEQCHPNKTFAVGLEPDGRTFRHRGCVGDMTVGPFVPWGLTCLDESFLKQQHGVGQFRATDITERNIHEMLFEIAEKRPYEHDPRNTHAYGSAKLLEAPILVGESASDVDLESFDSPIGDFSGVSVTFLSVEEVLEVANKEKFREKFDLVFCAANYFSFLKPQHTVLLKEDGIMVLETRQFSTMNKKEVSEFLKGIKDFAKEAGLESLTNFNLNLPYSTVKYKKAQSL